MKILHINSYYVNDFFYSNLYNYQKGLYDIDILVYKAVNTYNNFSKENSIVISPYRKYQKYFFMYKHYKIFNEISKMKLNYDLVHAHTLFTNGYQAYKINKQFNIPYIVAIRSTDINFFIKYFIHLRKIGLNILLNARKIVFISSVYRSKLLKYINKKYHNIILNKSTVITNGVNNYWLENKSDKISYSKNIKLLHVARVNKNKNAITIVKAIESLKEHDLNITLDIIGKVEDKKVFKSLMKYKYVNYHEFMSKEELIKYYKDSTIFILVSKHETYGISYLEAMSQGTPVVYSKYEGFDGQYTNGYVGYKCKYNDYKELAITIKKVLENYSCLRDNCLKEIENFSWDNIGQQYDDIYREIGESN
ncbi:MAG: glycosyltransferase family 4 protein [bacterium]